MRVYTDGSAKGNGKIDATGGWAFCVVDDNDEIVYEYCGAVENTTNNRMELTAFYMAAAYCVSKHINGVDYYSDSAYVVNAFNEGWISNWISNGWLNSKKEPVKNRDLWERLLYVLEDHFYTLHKTKGHSNDKWNNYVDKKAVKASTWLKEKQK